MARRTKEVPGRATLKGGGRATARPAPGRYTAPIPKEVKVSPVWVPVLLLALLILGMLVILLNYLGELPGGASNGYLLLGLGLITGGFITATKYH